MSPEMSRLPSPLKDRILAQAGALGFELVGVTGPQPPPHFKNFEDWLAQGRHGEMAYLETERSLERRADPRRILPECRSILVLGMRYPIPQPCEAEPGGVRGRVASYAWGDDYHQVIGERLRSLLTFIEEAYGAPVAQRWYTDTGPVLERDLAQRAGLGWIGKNTCLIHPRMGSYFLLGVILLGIELEPDEPLSADRCGSCTLCLQACPTRCILPDRTLEARRCISYLTIELKGPIPEEMRSQMGDWAFGCDICQQVCPWNKHFAQPQVEPAFEPRPSLPCPKLIDELRLSQEEFNRKFRDSPVKRAKRRGYLRNVAVALANQALASPEILEQAVAALAEVLENEPEPLVRLHAAWGLGQIGNRGARRALVNAIKTENDPDVQKEIQNAL
jgi:epoxyqueuosine reductase